MNFLAEFLYGGISKEILRGIAAVITCSTLFFTPAVGGMKQHSKSNP